MQIRAEMSAVSSPRLARDISQKVPGKVLVLHGYKKSDFAMNIVVPLILLFSHEPFLFLLSRRLSAYF